jgi:hypothetical protein
MVLLGDADGQFGLVVDEISDELNLVSRPLDERLGKVREIDALALLDDGGLALILDVPDLLQHMRDAPGWASNATSTLAARTDASRAELPADLRGALSPAGAARPTTTRPPRRTCWWWRTRRRCARSSGISWNRPAIGSVPR